MLIIVRSNCSVRFGAVIWFHSHVISFFSHVLRPLYRSFGTVLGAFLVLFPHLPPKTFSDLVHFGAFFWSRWHYILLNQGASRSQLYLKNYEGRLIDTSKFGNYNWKFGGGFPCVILYLGGGGALECLCFERLRGRKLWDFSSSGSFSIFDEKKYSPEWADKGGTKSHLLLFRQKYP